MMRRRGPTHDEFSEEIRQHVELERARLVDEGLCPEDAARLAHSRFGGVTVANERFYESTRMVWLDRLAQDVRSALRSLVKYPIAACVAVLSIGGGIGSTTAMLVVRDALFMKPPPLYEAPDCLSTVGVVRPERPGGSFVPSGLYSRWSKHRTLGPTLAAATGEAAINVRTDDRERTVPVRSVSAEFFSLLGVRPAVGRTFSSRITPEGSETAVLSHGIWQTLFDGRSDVLGQRLLVGEKTYTVIGVMPEQFWFSSMQPTIWTRLDVGSLAPDEGLQVVARRPPGLSAAGLEEQLQRELVAYAGQLPESQRRLRTGVGDLRGTPMANGMAKVTPWVFGTAVVLTLIIACANVAILVFAQWTAREREISVRASLGASRPRIVRLLITESVIVAALGGMLGVGVTFILRGLILYKAGDAVALFDLSIDPAVLIITAIITVFAGVATGLAPALIETARLHSHPLRAITTERVRQRWRHALVVLEISLTVALLVVAATLVDAYRRQFSLDLGFDTHGLVSARVENRSGVPVQRILEVIGAVPGVTAVAAASTVPLGGTGPFQTVSTDVHGSNPISAERVFAGTTFFQTLGVPMRAGRTFLSTETASGAPVAILNETLAHRLYPGTEPMGARMWMDGTPFEIVGMVADHATIGAHHFRPGVYLPLQPLPTTTRLQFIVRTTADPAPLVSALRRDIGRAAPGNLVTATRSLDQVIATGRQETLAGTVPLIPLFTMGLLLTAAGIYGVLAFAITRRSRELATRAAIGATGWDLWRLVTAQMLRLLVLGSGLAVATTFGLTRVVRAAGGGGSAFDTPSWQAFAVPVLVVVAVSALAMWMASSRVLRMNPALLLRAE